MAQKAEQVAEIGLLIYPGCQLAAIYGLTDLFRVAAEWTGDNARYIRVSHWEATADDVICIWDSHPGSPHRLSHAIAPPSIIMPERMAPAPAAAAWLRNQHDQGTVLCSVCAGAFVLAETGLMDGRRATTHWAFAEQLAKLPLRTAGRGTYGAGRGGYRDGGRHPRLGRPGADAG